VGAKGYAAAYSALAGQSPKRVVVLGTGHAMDEGLFGLTRKDFETPLGTVRTDKAAVKKLAAAGKGCLAPDDFAHRREHSIEIQVPFLQHVLGGSEFRLVPILCGSVMPHIAAGTRLGQAPGEQGFLDALRALASDPGTLVVAGVDFSHIGRKFGDRKPASAFAEEARSHDKRLADFLCARNADGFWGELKETNDRYHVCGATALAVLLAVLRPGPGGRLLHYETWYEDATESAVSFAAASFPV
jgi:MEMO1 family protein